MPHGVVELSVEAYKIPFYSVPEEVLNGFMEALGSCQAKSKGALLSREKAIEEKWQCLLGHLWMIMSV